MGGGVGGGEEAVRPVWRGWPWIAGDDAAGGLGDGDGRGEVHVVAQVALVDVRRPATGREPGHRQRASSRPAG